MDNHKDATTATPCNTCTDNTTYMLTAKYVIEGDILEAGFLTAGSSDFTYQYDAVVKFPVSNQSNESALAHNSNRRPR